MSRAKVLILKTGGRKYPIYRSESATDPDSGADIVSYSLYKEVLAWIQPTGSESSVKGVVLNESPGGDSVTAEAFMYHEEGLQNHDRVQDKGIWYEIRAIEPWECSFLKFWKSYLVKVVDEVHSYTLELN